MSAEGLDQTTEIMGTRFPNQHRLLNLAAWHDLVHWMRMRGSVDTERLANHIQRQIMLRNGARETGEKSHELLSEKKIFHRLIILLAVFDAAIADPEEREDLTELADQIARLFPERWPELALEIDEDLVAKLKQTTLTLLNEGGFKRPPDVVIRSLRPHLVGTRQLSTESHSMLREMVAGGRPAVGLPLYITTLQDSERALMGDENLRFELAALDKQNEKLRQTEAQAASKPAPARLKMAAAHA